MNKILYFFLLAFLFISQINASSEDENLVKHLNAEELKETVQNNEIVVVAFFDSIEVREYAYIQSIAHSIKEHDRIKFVVTVDKESNTWATEKLNVIINNPGLIIFNKGIGYPIPFDKIHSKPMYNPRELCLKALKPPVDELTYNENDFNFDNILYFYADEEDKKSKFQLMQRLSEAYFQEFYVKYININKNPLNLDLPELKSKFVIVTKNIQSYYRQMDALGEEYETNFENISYFINAYKSATIDPIFLWRSEEMNWGFTDYVTEISPNIYDDVVLNTSNDVIVLYYKSDCPYSQQVMKSFQTLGKRYIDQRHKLTVAQYEAENQNIPKSSPWRNLVEYPTIVLYPSTKNEKKRQFYVMKNNLGRSAINIASWLLKRANNYYDDVIYNADDYKNLSEIDGGMIVQDEQEELEEIKTNKLLEDPNLIYTIFGQGLDQKFYSVKEGEEFNYYTANTVYGEIPLTSVYYELTPTTYVVHQPEITNSPKEIARQKAIEKQQREQQN